MVGDNSTTLFLNQDLITGVLINTLIVTHNDSYPFLQDMNNAAELIEETSLLLLDNNMPNKKEYEILKELDV